jgi:hypothetical protein
MNHDLAGLFSLMMRGFLGSPNSSALDILFGKHGACERGIQHFLFIAISTLVFAFADYPSLSRLRETAIKVGSGNDWRVLDGAPFCSASDIAAPLIGCSSEATRGGSMGPPQQVSSECLNGEQLTSVNGKCFGVSKLSF